MIKKLYLKLFKPYVYIIERNSFLGDFSQRVKVKEITDEGIKTEKDSYLFSEVFFFERNAKKEIAKTSLKYDPKNVELARKIQKAGMPMTQYSYIQVLEDGEASETYQRFQERFLK